MIETVVLRDGGVRYLDQTRLPGAEIYRETASWEEVAGAILPKGQPEAPGAGGAPSEKKPTSKGKSEGTSD